MKILTHIETRYDSTMTPYITLTLRQDGYERQPEDYGQYLGQPITISSGYTTASDYSIWHDRITYNDLAEMERQFKQVEMEFID